MAVEEQRKRGKMKKSVEFEGGELNLGDSGTGEKQKHNCNCRGIKLS